MEHVKCNFTYVLYHLHRSLKPEGWHICVIPFCSGYYDECLGDIGAEEATRRFSQADHVRCFGRDDIESTLGKVLKFGKAIDVTKDFSPATLREANIPERSWRGLTADTVLCLRKYDMKLLQRPNRWTGRIRWLEREEAASLASMSRDNLQPRADTAISGPFRSAAGGLRLLTNKVLPPGTRVRYYCRLGLAGIRIIMHEGWRSFFSKMRAWLRARRAVRNEDK